MVGLIRLRGTYLTLGSGVVLVGQEKKPRLDERKEGDWVTQAKRQRRASQLIWL